MKFSPEMTDILDDIVAENAVATRSGIPSTDEVLSILGAYSLQRVFPVDARTEKKTREAGLHLWYRVRFDKNMDIDAAVTRLAALGEVSKIQKNPVIKRAYASDKKPIVVSDNARLSTKGVSSFRSMTNFFQISGGISIMEIMTSTGIVMTMCIVSQALT